MYRLGIVIIAAAALLAGCAAPGQPPNDTNKAIEAIGGAVGAVLPFLLAR